MGAWRTHACLRIAVLVVCLQIPGAVAAQIPTGAAPSQAPAAPPVAERPTDSLGRDTPRGTVFGFMNALRRGNDEAGVAYLNTPLRGDAAREFARHLYVVLDSRLPARLPELTDRPEGTLANPFKPNQDVVGTIETANGPLDLILERVERNGQPIWLFSRATLEKIPDVYAEIDLISVDRHLPGFLTKPHLAGVRLFEWLVFLIAIPLFYRLVGDVDRLLVRAAAMVRGKDGAGRTGVLSKGFRLLLLAAAIRWLTGSVDLPLAERQFWLAVAKILAVSGATWLLLSLNAAGERYIKRRSPRTAAGEMAALLRLARRFADVLAIAAGVLAALAYFDIDPTAALAGLGIGGIAVALAAQKTLENVIGGLSIVFDNAVRVGDTLKVGEICGTVDAIGLRSTRIRTLDRTILTVPNGQLASINVETLSERDKFWFHHFVALRYETTSSQMRAVIDALRRMLDEHRAVDREVVRVRFFRLGPFSLDIEIFTYLRAADWDDFLTIQQELLLRTMEIVEQAGTRVALPSQVLHLTGAAAEAPALPAGAGASA